MSEDKTNDAALPNLVGYLDKMFVAGGWSGKKAKSIHASSIGFPCARHLAYQQVSDYDGGGGVNLRLQRIFEVGKMFGEQAVIDMMIALKGTPYECVQAEKPLPENKWNIGGRIDLFVKLRSSRDTIIPVEVKSCSDRTFASTDSLRDMMEHKFVFIRKWPGQLLTYMKLLNLPGGLFLLRCKSTGEYKQIPVHLSDNEDYCTELLGRADAVCESVGAYRSAKNDKQRLAALPARIEYDPGVCDWCDYKGECFPDLSQIPNVDIIWDVELEAYLKIRDETEEAACQWAEADGKIKAHAKAVAEKLDPGQQKVLMLEHHTITAKVSSTTLYKVPTHLKQLFPEPGRMVRVNIKRLDEEVPA